MKKEDKTVIATEKRQYQKPVVQSEKAFVRSALSCSRSPYLNNQTDLKDDWDWCGYSDS